MGDLDIWDTGLPSPFYRFGPAAVAVVRADGWPALTPERVARAAGTHRATVYRRIGNVHRLRSFTLIYARIRGFRDLIAAAEQLGID